MSIRVLGNALHICRNAGLLAPNKLFWALGRKNYHKSTDQHDDEALLREIENDTEDLEQGPKYWHKEYGRRLSNISKTIDDTLEQHLANNLERIKSYNQTVSLSPIQRIQVDPSKEDVTFKTFFQNPLLLQCLKKYLGSTQPTEFQKRLFALSTGHLSTIAKGDSGSGRTIAIICHALFLRRRAARGPGISSLIVVKSTDLVLKYQQIINDIYSHLPEAKKATGLSSLAQFLYRSDTETETKQQATLAENPVPHILVTTPQRLLDILSTRGMDYVQIHNLPFIAVDDFDSMLDENLLLTSSKEAPVVTLLNYVLKLQDYKRSHNEPHPQVILTVSSATNDSLTTQIKEKTEWIDWSKFHLLGSFQSENELSLSNLIPSNVALSSILIQPQLSSSKKKLKVQLFDMKKLEYGTEPTDWHDKCFRTLNGHDLYYSKHRKLRRGKMTKELKKIELEVLVTGLIKLLKKKTFPQRSKRILIVHPDEVSGLAVQKLVQKSGRLCKIFDINQDTDFFKKPFQMGIDPQFLLINSSALTGLTFEELDTQIILGIDAIKGLSNFVCIGGRFRNATGLIDESEFPMFGERSSSETQNTLYLLNSKLDFQNAERNHLERLCIRAGLVEQLATVGVTEFDFDQTAYSEEFSSLGYEIEADY